MALRDPDIDRPFFFCLTPDSRTLRNHIIGRYAAEHLDEAIRSTHSGIANEALRLCPHSGPYSALTQPSQLVIDGVGEKTQALFSVYGRTVLKASECRIQIAIAEFNASTGQDRATGGPSKALSGEITRVLECCRPVGAVF